MKKNLKVCWVSAGVSSFMAGYLAGNVDKWIYIDVADQHPDSIRFIKDCEKALGIDIEILRSTEYGCVEDCIRVFGGFRDAHSGFAPCTNWLKKRIRKSWEAAHPDYDLTYVWGYDLNEIPRAENMIEANPQVRNWCGSAIRITRQVKCEIRKT